jgi:hypothetical protein
MLGYILDYVVIGFITCCATVLAHIVIAERRGYRAFNYWEDEVLPNLTRIAFRQWLWSITIWPIRVWQFIVISHVLYEAYRHRNDRLKEFIVRGR